MRVPQLSAQELGGLLTRAMEATAGLRAPAQRNPVARGTTLGQEVQMWPWAPTGAQNASVRSVKVLVMY